MRPWPQALSALLPVSYYRPAAAAPSEEVIDVCVPLKEFGGIYCTHMRNEADRVLESLHESFESARQMGVPVVISHHKVTASPTTDARKQTLALIERQMRAQPIGLDCYPYSAASTVLSADRAAAASRTVVTWSKPHPEFAGKDLTEIAKDSALAGRYGGAIATRGGDLFLHGRGRRATHPIVSRRP